MFAGKSEELLRRVRRARIARRGVPSHTVSHAEEIPGLLDPGTGTEAGTELVAVDEAQFFGPGLVAAVDALVAGGVDVVVSGLCVTFDGRPFEPLPALMAIAEDVLKLTAVCAVCGEDAAFHQRLSSGGGDPLTPTTEQIGGIESYQARCRRHFTGAAPA